jgi:hypothetical protein
VLEKDEEDSWTDRVRNEVTQSQGREEYPTNKKRRKANFIGYILRKNSILNHLTEIKIRGRI